MESEIPSTQTDGPVTLHREEPRKHHILVVDDEPENLDLLASTLRRGNKIFKASSGEEALEILEKEEIHMVISDQMMPGISGTELLAKLKDEKPAVIRMLITGYGDMKVAMEAINMGQVHRYASKPWDPKEIQTVVAMELERFDLQEKAKRLTEDLLRKNEELRKVNQEVLYQKRQLEELHKESLEQKELALEMSEKFAKANMELIRAQEEINRKNEKLEAANRKLERLSITDGLTGFFNHRHMHTLLDNEVGRAKRYDLKLSCMMVDMDFFKKINDTYGHLFGDKVIKKITEIIRKNIRDTDMPTRYGGDEFLIILPHTSEDRAIFLARRIHTEASEYVFTENGNDLKQTVSIGIASIPHAKITDKDEFLKAVDAALYIAKEKGRNCVVTFPE